MLDFEDLFARDVAPPVARFKGLPRFNFVGGNNDPELVPVEGLVEAVTTALRREGKALSMYNMGLGPQGHPSLCAFVADKLQRQRGIAGTADDILITSGSNQALDLVNRVFLEPGDTVLMEAHTYAGAIGRVKKTGAKIVPMPLDEAGIIPERLADVLERLRGEGVRPKYLYTIPTIQNPTGSVLPVERRRALLDISARFGVPIFEDECYADLLWHGEWPQAIRGMPGGEQVIHVGSFSKSLAPALRLGYVSAPWEVMSRLVAHKDDGGTPAIEQMMVAEYFGAHFDEHLTALKGGLARKLEVLTEALAEQFGTAAEFRMAPGGIFLWVNLPEAIDTSVLAAKAADAGVAINPGAEWSADPAAGRHSMRLCFALPPAADIRAGVAKLAEVCHAQFGIPELSANVRRTS